MAPDAPVMIRNSVGLQMDGTFRSTPPGFKQVYIICSVDKANNTFPVMYCLLPSKESEVYSFVLKSLKGAVGEDFSPKFIMIDFESAMVEAVETEFPDTELQGCHFHFKQVQDRK